MFKITTRTNSYNTTPTQTEKLCKYHAKVVKLLRFLALQFTVKQNKAVL